MSLLLVCVLVVFAAHGNSASECGTALPKVQEKVSHGDLAAPGRWPWAVYVIIKNSFCTGSLISSRFVLTAQHCVGAKTDP
ncbi:serine collagenase 1 precursor, partial [Aphelenchoides avenae]